ncbi:MAG: macrocin O-methyltransferase, partial [Verrucomicrobia bacterium]|nr:macrocin O-methyltransferase [Verrucomicrobiota bacterium]
MHPLRKLCRRFGFDVVPFRKSALPPDFDAGDQRIINSVKPYTMTGPERLFAVIHATRYVAQRPVAGAIVECGVWRGGSMMAAALALLALESTRRQLHFFDTFDGMSAPGDVDIDWQGRPARDLLQLATDEGDL